MISIKDINKEYYNLWLYSRNYHNQFLEILSLYDAGFYRPAFILYYQLFENIVRSYLDGWEVRRTEKLFNNLAKKLGLNKSEIKEINGFESSLRTVRNTVIHKDCSTSYYTYQEVLYMYSEQSTYKVIFDNFYPIIDSCINKILDNLSLGLLDNVGELSEEA